MSCLHRGTTFASMTTCCRRLTKGASPRWCPVCPAASFLTRPHTLLMRAWWVEQPVRPNQWDYVVFNLNTKILWWHQMAPNSLYSTFFLTRDLMTLVKGRSQEFRVPFGTEYVPSVSRTTLCLGDLWPSKLGFLIKDGVGSLMLSSPSHRSTMGLHMTQTLATHMPKEWLIFRTGELVTNLLPVQVH